EGNTYGHPHQEVLDRLDARNINTYGTDVHGNIVVTTDGVDSEIHTDKDGEVAAGKMESSEQETASTSSTSTPEEKVNPANDWIDINTASKEELQEIVQDRKSTRLNSSHVSISYAVFCLNKKN